MTPEEEKAWQEEYMAEFTAWPDTEEAAAIVARNPGNLIASIIESQAFRDIVMAFRKELDSV